MIKEIHFNVTDLNTTINFYTKVLGFKIHNRTENSVTLLLNNSSALLKMQALPNSIRVGKEPNSYWKIGIIVPDLDLAYKGLQLQGVHCSRPSQFLDIGYLLHIKDPDNNVIELLQSVFQHETLQDVIYNDSTIRQHAALAHLSLRTANLEESIQFYQSQFGMQLHATMDATPYQFTLCFLGYCKDTLNAPKDSIEKRKWLWRQPETCIELQYYWNFGEQFKYNHPITTNIGFSSVVISGSNNQAIISPEGISITSSHKENL